MTPLWPVMMASALLRMGRLKGVNRPAIATVIPVIPVVAVAVTVAVVIAIALVAGETAGIGAGPLVVAAADGCVDGMGDVTDVEDGTVMDVHPIDAVDAAAVGIGPTHSGAYYSARHGVDGWTGGAVAVPGAREALLTGVDRGPNGTDRKSVV